ncbi:MAG: hypothetical protein ACT4QE_24820 [Anaerolineales bacterium]
MVDESQLMNDESQRVYDDPPSAAIRRESLLTVETALYLTFFALAAALRFLNLSLHPLNDPEAREALSVLHFLRGELGPLPASPVYFFFTYFGFLVLGPETFIARFVPALAGSLIVLTPWPFRDVLGRGSALVTSALLTISSGLIAASRGVDGTLIVVLALSVCLALLLDVARSSESNAALLGAAVALGVALTGGAAFFTGALLLALTLGLFARVHYGETLSAIAERVWAERWAVLGTVALTVVVVSTVGVVYRAGLGALGNSAVNWLQGFGLNAEGRSVFVIPVFLIAYEPLLLIFGLIGAVRAFRRALGAGQNVPAQTVAAFGVLAFMFVVAYSGRAIVDSVWLILPLAVLAGSAIAELVEANATREDWPLAGALIAVLVIILGFASIKLLQFGEAVRLNPALLETLPGAGLIANAPGLILAVLAILVAVLVIYLFAVGWSARAARLGATLTGVAVLAFVTLGAGWGLTQLRPTEPVELWWERPASDDLYRLEETLMRISDMAVGQEREIDVTVQAEPDGALAWALRNFSKATLVDDASAFITSRVVITPKEQDNPELGQAYAGQGFDLYRYWFPENLFLNEQLDWLAFRRAPTQAQQIILWVRQDVQQLDSATP